MVNKIPLPRLPISERHLLVYTNVLLALFSTLLVATCSLIIDQLFTSAVPTYDSTQAAIQGSRIFVYVVLILCLGLWVLITCLIGIFAAIRVNFVMLMFYFWSILLASPLVCIFSVLCLDFHEYFRTWSHLSWTQDDMRRIRSFFCDDAATSLNGVDSVQTSFGRESVSNYECAVPTDGGQFYPSEVTWCGNHTSYDDHTSYDYREICSSIRDAAQHDFYEWALTWLNVLGALGVVSTLLMSVCDSLVVKIVTGKTILNKLQHIINTLLLMPISFCALIGVYVHLQHTRLRSDEYWLGMMFVAIAGVTFIFAIVGAFGGRKKDRLLLMVHMIGTGFCVVGLTACCFISYYAVGKVEQDYPVSSEEEVQDVACDSGQSTCCCCDEVVNSTTGYYSDDRCKEWSRADLVTLIQFDLKLAALISLLSIVFAVASIIVSATLHRQLRDHKSAYI